MLGERLLQLARGCSRQALLIAPFMKRATLARLLAEIPTSVPVACVTRWRPDEIAAGVSDPEVWLLLKGRGSLRLCDELHAKAYAFDDRCLVGSANITDTALGWREPSNLEVLIEVSRTAPEVAALETRLAKRTVDVDDSLFAAAMHAASVLRAQPARTGEVTAEHGLSPDWLPGLRNPEGLFDAYSGEWERLTSGASESAKLDLRTLRIPLGLGRGAFERVVALRLLQVPVISGIDQLLASPRRFGEVRDYLARHASRSDLDWDSAWQTLMRWLRHFMPERYVLSVPSISEVMVRRDALEDALKGGEEVSSGGVKP